MLLLNFPSKQNLRMLERRLVKRNFVYCIICAQAASYVRLTSRGTLDEVLPNKQKTSSAVREKKQIH